MHRNPGLIGSSLLPIITVVVLAGIVGLSIPMVLGGGGPSRGQGVVQVFPTPTSSQTVAALAETPAEVAIAVGRSDGALGPSSKSTIVFSPAIRSESATPTAILPVVAQRVETLSPTPFVAQSTPTASSTAAVVQPSATLFATNTSSPTATTPPISTAKAVSRPNPAQTPRRLPSPVPQPTAAKAIPAAPPELISPSPDARPSGVAVFEWRPAVPLDKGQAYEIVVWSPEQDPNQAWGIAPPTPGKALEINLDQLFESGQFPEGSLYWTVLVVQKQPYTRLTLPSVSPQRYLVYTVPE